MSYMLVLLIGLVGARLEDPPTVGPEENSGDARVQALAAYERMKEKAKPTAVSQYALAVWCEKNGLQPEMVAHLTEVVRLDPSRDSSWRKLGFKKVKGRWLNPDEIAEGDVQNRANKIWGPRLEAIHRRIHHRSDERRAAAWDDLNAIEEPRAVPAIHHEFGRGSAADQLIAVHALGRIDSPGSTQTLAFMSVYGQSPEVRRRAAESLRARDSEDYLGLLVELLVDPVKYEVKPITGPGTVGGILIQGDRHDVQRVYHAPVPDLGPRPGDVIDYDATGAPVILRRLGPGFRYVNIPGVLAKRSGKVLQRRSAPVEQINVPRAIEEANRATAVARAQLAEDVASLEDQNRQINRFNHLVIAVAKQASGQLLGDSPDAWREAFATKKKAYAERSEKPKPRYTDLVPLAYQPRYSELGFMQWMHVAPAG